MKKVINLLFNDFTNDNRVLKESRTLQKNGFEVLLVATHFDRNLPKEERIEGFTVKRIGVGYGYPLDDIKAFKQYLYDNKINKIVLLESLIDGDSFPLESYISVLRIEDGLNLIETTELRNKMIYVFEVEEGSNY